MAKTKISEFDANPDNNTDINSINIAEGCAPSGINNAIRQLMADLKDFQTGSGGDPFNGAINGTVGATTPNTGSFTTLTSSGTTTLNGTTIPASKTLLVTTDIGTSVQAYDADLTAWAGKTAPTGDAVGTSDTQTLTNKTISADNNTISGIAASSFVLSNGSGNLDGSASQKAIPSGVVVGTTDTQTLSNKTITNLIMDGYIREEVFDVSGTTPALSPSNGTIQTWTLTGNSTPTQGTWSAGESMTLMINDGTAFTVTWTSVPITWVGGSAPTLATTGFTVIELWEVGTTIYGALVGNVA